MFCDLCGAKVTIYMYTVPLCSNCAMEIIDGKKKLLDSIIAKQSSQDIATKLDSELESARQRFKEAQKDFEEATAQADHIGLSDGAQRIRIAGREYHSASEVFMRAMNRSSKFKTEGVIPEDLKVDAHHGKPQVRSPRYL